MKLVWILTSCSLWWGETLHLLWEKCAWRALKKTESRLECDQMPQRNWEQTGFCTHVLDAHLKSIQIVHELTRRRGLICGGIFAFPNSKAKARKTASHVSLLTSNVADQRRRPVKISQTGLSKLSQTGMNQEIMINLLESESREQPITAGTP